MEDDEAYVYEYSDVGYRRRMKCVCLTACLLAACLVILTTDVNTGAEKEGNPSERHFVDNIHQFVCEVWPFMVELFELSSFAMR